MNNASYCSGGGIPIRCNFHCLRLGDRYLGIDWGGGYGSLDEEPVYNGPLDWLFLSHGHHDHVTMLPKLVRKRPGLKVFASKATLALSLLAWRETIFLANKRKVEPPFGEQDIQKALDSITVLEPNQEVELADGIKAIAPEAGHILGAQSLLASYGGEFFFVTGDICFHDRYLIAGAPKFSLERCRLLARESTYISYRPEDRQYREKTRAAVVEAAKAVLSRGGRLLIPALTMDRTQDVFGVLYKSGLWPIFIDGARKATEIYLEFLGEKAADLKKALRFHNDRERQVFLNSRQPGIIIASSGMVYPGTLSAIWAQHFLYRPPDAIFLVNYQDPGGQGFVLKNAKRGDFIRFNGSVIKVECERQDFNFSAHMDGHEGEELENRLNPDIIVYGHGERKEIEEYIQTHRGGHATRILAEPGKEIQL